MPTALQLWVLPLEERPHWSPTMARTGRMKRKGLMIMARVRRAQLMRAELGLTAVADIASREGAGTSHKGVTRERPRRMRRKVMPSPVELLEMKK
jgi:hypothetical protein